MGFSVVIKPMIYIFIILLLLFFSFRYDFCGRKDGRILCYNIVLVLLILIAGLRWRVGTDTIAYINRFYHDYPTIDNFSFGDYGIGNDPFYALINVIVKSLGGRFYMVQIIQASIVNILVFKYIKRHTNFIFTCVLLYFFISYVNYTMEVMRGSISIVICLFGNDYIQDKKWIKGYALYLLALMFHIQTIVLFFLPCLFFIRLNKYGLLLLVAAFVTGLFLKTIFESYLSLVESGVIENEIEDKLYSDKYGTSHGNLLFFVGLLLVKFVYPILSLLYIKKYGENEMIMRLEPFMVFGLMFVLLQISFPIAFRYVYYYELYFALFYSKVLSLMSDRLMSLSKGIRFTRAYLLFFPVLLYYGYARYSTHKYHPYTSVIEKSVNKEKEEVFKERNHYFAPDKNKY